MSNIITGRRRYPAAALVAVLVTAGLLLAIAGSNGWFRPATARAAVAGPIEPEPTVTGTPGNPEPEPTCTPEPTATTTATLPAVPVVARSAAGLGRTLADPPVEYVIEITFDPARARVLQPDDVNVRVDKRPAPNDVFGNKRTDFIIRLDDKKGPLGDVVLDDKTCYLVKSSLGDAKVNTNLSGGNVAIFEILNVADKDGTKLTLTFTVRIKR
jgi:hypothetical protein